ncbi:GSCOCG00004386001-RA-CDS [Cotesia congregata]|nr:GSCOCG00004386001-RA-CDS [Cotesia congregata]
MSALLFETIKTNRNPSEYYSLLFSVYISTESDRNNCMGCVSTGTILRKNDGLLSYKLIYFCGARVAWPPPQDHDQVDYIEQSPVQAKTRGLGEHVSYQSSPVSGPSPQPISPGGSLKQPSHFQQQPNLKNWAAVTPPTTSPTPTWNQHSNQSPSHYQPQSQPVNFEPPPTTITLRPKAPFSQDPAPVYQAQPAATMAPMSGVMRGDLKWPPESVKQQSELENQARMALAKGPACRPRRVNKDYGEFFAQHALNSNYPGYRAPPGTQYFTPSYQH